MFSDNVNLFAKGGCQKYNLVMVIYSILPHTMQYKAFVICGWAHFTYKLGLFLYSWEVGMFIAERISSATCENFF